MRLDTDYFGHSPSLLSSLMRRVMRAFISLRCLSLAASFSLSRSAADMMRAIRSRNVSLTIYPIYRNEAIFVTTPIIKFHVE
jgi:hypothetical protein